MKKRPILTGSILFMSGIIFASRVQVGMTFWLIMTGTSFFATLFFAFVPGGKTEKRRMFLTLFLAFSLLWGGAFWFSLSQYPQGFSDAYEGLEVRGQGVVISYPREGEWSNSCYLRVQEVNLGEKNLLAKRQVLFKFKLENGQLYSPGDQVQFQGKIELPAEARNPGEFNYRQYLANRGVFWVLNCSRGKVELCAQGQGLQAWTAKGRKQIVTHLNKILPPREKGLLLGILFGDTQSMAEEEWEAYRRAGVVHLFAVSGLHVGLVLALVWFLLSFFHPRPGVRLFTGAVVLLSYGFLVGWSASILRSAVMAILALLALTVSQKNDFYNSLGVAAGIILILCPGELFQVGFQLSFLTTAGIVYLTPWLMRKGFPGFLATPSAAFLASAPLLAFHFNQVSLISPFVNVLAVAVTGCAAVLAFIAVPLTWLVPFLATPFFLAAGLLMYLLSEILIWTAGFNWAGINVATPSLIVMVGVYLVLLSLPFWAYSRYLLREIPGKIKGGVIAFFVFLLFFTVGPFPREMTVVFLDVGQGDSIFLKTPTGKTALIDGGGTPASSFAVGKRIISPVLAHYGVNRIKLMMMSHHHLDHSEGLWEILPDYAVGAFLQPPREENSVIEDLIREVCARKKIPVKELTAGAGVFLDKNVFLEILHPTAKNIFAENNRSLVVKMKYKNCTWLFTGDIEKEAIAELLVRGVDLQADILKIPHHGSISSFVPAFYEKVNPQAVVISVGENRFNQPHPQVLQYFQERGIPVFITHEKGAVLMKSNGRKTGIQTFL